MRARDIMSTPVTAVRPGTPIKEAAALLATAGGGWPCTMAS